MALALSRATLGATKPAVAPRRSAAVAPVRALSSDGANREYRAVGSDEARAAGDVVATPFDDYKFAPIREATVSRSRGGGVDHGGIG